MSRRIIGVTVGTPMSISTIKDKLKPITSVNGVEADENGNVEITIPDSGGNVDFQTDETLTLKDGVLSVNTTNDMEQDNTLPITSAAVFAEVGNINALLETI